MPQHATTSASIPASINGIQGGDLQMVMQRLTQNDAPRWMLIKEGLDHGPFSARELVGLMLRGEALGNHELLNIDSNERYLANDIPDFAVFLQQYAIKQRSDEHKHALERSKQSEKRSNLLKILIALGIVGAIAAVGVVLVVMRDQSDSESSHELDLADLYEQGDIKIKGQAGLLNGSRSGGKRRSDGSAGASSKGGASFEDAMNQAMNLGDASKGGGEARLSTAAIAKVMNAKINKLFSCVSAELRAGNKLSTVQIDLAIAGSGKVLGASTRQGTASFRQCVSTKARGIHFPSFSAPRMGARYSFSVD